jgi:Plasmid pRiA4b ORF-3-like protein
MLKRTPEPHSELLLEIVLSEHSPRIWRRVIVSELLTLADLHEVLQIVMGWLNYHLYEFEIEGGSFTTIDEDTPSEAIDSATVSLRELGLSVVGATFTYDYDFGDGWSHLIKVVEVSSAEAFASHPRCVAGERSGPPEDCGGPHRYQEILEILEDPAHPEFREIVDWLPIGFDPAELDVSEINVELDEFFKGQVN